MQKIERDKTIEAEKCEQEKRHREQEQNRKIRTKNNISVLSYRKLGQFFMTAPSPGRISLKFQKEFKTYS